MTIHVNDLADERAQPGATFGRVELPGRPGLYRNVAKRLFDIGSVLISAIVVFPVVAILALIVSLDGNAPFYTQERVGKNGRIFRMFKLRSMVPNADRLLAAYLAADPIARAEWESTQKLRRDPRITPIGRLIRKTSLDELPQLWNVLIGDMSVVGPRPMLPEQRVMYPGTSYYALRPGITGLWQVSDRNESAFSKRAHFDTDYDRNLSLGLDLSILLRTVSVVLRGTGF